MDCRLGWEEVEAVSEGNSAQMARSDGRWFRRIQSNDEPGGDVPYANYLCKYGTLLKDPSRSAQMAFEGGLDHEEHLRYRDPQTFQRLPAERLSGEVRLLRLDLVDKGVDPPSPSNSRKGWRMAWIVSVIFIVSSAALLTCFPRAAYPSFRL